MLFIEKMFSSTPDVSAVSSAVTEELTGFAAFFASYGSLIIMGLVLVGLYFLMIRPQRKKEKAATEKRNNIEIGDEITTIGGIVGRVVTIKDDAFVLETGGDRTRMRFKRWAIQDINKLELESPGEGVSAPKAEDAAKK